MKEANLDTLNRLPKGYMIAAPSNIGFTDPSLHGPQRPVGPLPSKSGRHAGVLHAGLTAPGRRKQFLAMREQTNVVFCPGVVKCGKWQARAPDGLAAALLKDRPPAFLKDATPAGAPNLKVYRLVR